jgi:hypothetical protein
MIDRGRAYDGNTTTWPGEPWDDETLRRVLFGSATSSGMGKILRHLAEHPGERVGYPELNQQVFGPDARPMQLAGQLSQFSRTTRRRRWPFATYRGSTTPKGHFEYEMSPESALQVARLVFIETVERAERKLRRDSV